MLKIDEKVTIKSWELSEQFIKATGFVRHHVNKASSAVELIFQVVKARSLSQINRVLKNNIPNRGCINQKIYPLLKFALYQFLNRLDFFLQQVACVYQLMLVWWPIAFLVRLKIFSPYPLGVLVRFLDFEFGALYHRT